MPGSNNTYKVFLASSYHLKKERDEIQKAFNALNDGLQQKNAYLELVLWEKLDAGNHPDRKQSFYNAQLADCSILIMLYQGQIGGFTKEEYLIAEGHFRDKGLPRIYLFKKNTPETFELNPENVQHLQELEQIFYQKENAQWPWEFDHYEGIVRKINEDINRLFEASEQPHFHYGEPAKLLSQNGVNDPTVFVGRDEDLKEISERLRNNGSILLVNAEGGIGKTTLAARYWNNTLYHYKYHAWLFCGNGILNALTELAPALGVDLGGMDENQQIKALKQSIIHKQDRFLLVLDNANNEKDIKAFQREFQGLQWHVLITSRCKGAVPKEKEMVIEHLPPQLAMELFKKYYTEESAGFEKLLDSLLSGLHYHTLCIELFAKTMQELATRGETLQHLVLRLEEHGLFLGVRSFEIITDYTTQTRIEAINSDEILDRFYDFTQLAENERYWLVNMALLPAEEYPFTFLCKLFGQDPILFNELHALLKRGWLNETKGSFRISPVIQKLTLKRNAEKLGEDAQALLEECNRVLETDGYNFMIISLSEAEPFLKLIFHLNKCLKEFAGEVLALTNFNCGVGYENIGNLVSAKVCYTEYQHIYKSLLMGSPQNHRIKYNLAASFAQIGSICEATGDWKNALLNYEEEIRIFKEIYDINPENLTYKFAFSASYARLGSIYEATGDWKNAQLNYKKYNKLCSQVYESKPENLSYKNGLAISYKKLGGIFEATGDWKNALLNYQKDFRLTKEIYESSPENQSYKEGLAISYEKLGIIYEMKGDYKNALQNYQERNKIGKEIYESCPENLSYKNGLAISYSKLGGIFEATGDWNNALLLYVEYNKLSREIYESCPENLRYKKSLAISCSRLGGIYEETKDWQTALLNFEEYNNLSKEINESNPENMEYKSGLATSYAKLAVLQEKLDEFPKAITNWEHALELFKVVAADFPENTSFQNNLGWAVENYERLKEAFI